MESHQGSKYSQCSMCPNEFSTEEALQKHHLKAHFNGQDDVLLENGGTVGHKLPNHASDKQEVSPSTSLIQQQYQQLKSMSLSMFKSKKKGRSARLSFPSPHSKGNVLPKKSKLKKASKKRDAKISQMIDGHLINAVKEIDISDASAESSADSKSNRYKLKCRLCKKNFSDVIALNYHIILSHAISVESNVIDVNDQEQLETFEVSTIGKATKHKGFPCISCERRFKTENSLNAHYEDAHLNSTDSRESPTIPFKVKSNNVTNKIEKKVRKKRTKPPKVNSSAKVHHRSKNKVKHTISGESIEEAYLRCIECNEMFPSDKAVNDHYLSKHLGECLSDEEAAKDLIPSQSPEKVTSPPRLKAGRKRKNSDTKKSKSVSPKSRISGDQCSSSISHKSRSSDNEMKSSHTVDPAQSKSRVTSPENSIIRCSDCFKTFKNTAALNYHAIYSHPEVSTPVKFDVDVATENDHRSLRGNKHQKGHTEKAKKGKSPSNSDKPVNRCLDCKKNFKSADALQYHEILTHPDLHMSGDTSQIHHSKHKTKVCSQNFESKISLKDHHKNSHESDSPSSVVSDGGEALQISNRVKCKLCKKIFDNDTALNFHHILSHPNDDMYTENADAEKLLHGKHEQRSDCANTIRNDGGKSKIKSHKKVFSCDLCSRNFRNVSSYLYHYIRTHPDQGISDIENHQQVAIKNKAADATSPELDYSCDHCKRRFKSQSTLQYHVIRTHSLDSKLEDGKPIPLETHVTSPILVSPEDKRLDVTEIIKVSPSSDSSFLESPEESNALRIQLKRVRSNESDDWNIVESPVSKKKRKGKKRRKVMYPK